MTHLLASGGLSRFAKSPSAIFPKSGDKSRDVATRLRPVYTTGPNMTWKLAVAPYRG